MPDSHPLVFRFGAFGDMVMITPLLKRLYERGGLPCDVIGTGAWCSTMYQQMPYVRDVFTIPSRGTPYFLSPDKRRLASTLRQREQRNVWILEQNRNSYRLAAKAGITDSINAIDIPRQPAEHMSHHWLRLANMSPAGFDFPPAEDQQLDTELFVSEEELDACRGWLKENAIDPDAPIICIQPGNKKTTRAGRIDRDSNTKYWHETNWAKVIDRITEQDKQANIIICGIAAERAMSLDIYDLCQHRDRVHCAAGDLPMRRLFALLSIAHSCISVDTGPAHAAAALNCDVTVLFAKADARLYSPVSAHSKVAQLSGRIPGTELLQTAESWAACHDIGLITAEQVFEAWSGNTQAD